MTCKYNLPASCNYFPNCQEIPMKHIRPPHHNICSREPHRVLFHVLELKQSLFSNFDMSATSLLEVAFRLQVVKYTKMAGLAILVFDYFIKLEDEIRFTWRRKWDFVRILFVLARYVPFAFTSVDLMYSAGPESPQHCLILYEVTSWINVISTAAAEAILFVRTYTLWGKNRVILVGILTLAMGCLAGSGLVGAHALSLFDYQDPPLGTSGCYQAKRIEIYIIDYALLSLYETVILTLSGLQLWYLRRQGGTHFSIGLFWDGIIYVVCILMMSVANIVAIMAFPSEYAGSTRSLQAVFHSVLSSRLLFNLRAIVQRQRQVTVLASTQTSIQFNFEHDIPLYSKHT